MARMFGTDGVRGIANEELTPLLAMQLGQAGAYVLTKENEHKPTIMVGCDTRISGDMLANALMARYRERFSRYSSTVPSFDQYTLAAFMHTGGFERHISRSRKVYQARRDALMAALDRELADLPHEVSRSEAGLHLLLHMRNGMLEHELIERAKAVGVRVYPLSAY